MPVPHDFRKYSIPKFWSIEILMKLEDMKMHEFSSREISDLFQISIAEACTRINILKRFNLVKLITKKIHPAIYKITSWGHKYTNDNRDKFKDREGKY